MKKEVPNSGPVKQESEPKLIFSIPNIEELSTAKFEDLQVRWRVNHFFLLDFLRKHKVPYFGLHGTPAEEAEQIKNSEGGHFNLVTFYEKESSEKFLYQLYHAALYPISYAYKSVRRNESDKLGEVMVFDLEHNGKNITLEWERLYPGVPIYLTLDSDLESQKKSFELLDSRENLLWRTDKNFGAEEFLSRYKGSIKLDGIEILINKLQCFPPEEFARTIIAKRFLAQEIVLRTLQLVT